MSNYVLIGRGRAISRIPQAEWEEELKSAPGVISKRLNFMSDEHHQVRNFVVRELPRMDQPIAVSTISDALGIPLQRTMSIVSDLERNLFFLVRHGGKEVSWAFPVTVEQTGHHLTFSTGERLEAA